MTVGEISLDTAISCIDGLVFFDTSGIQPLSFTPPSREAVERFMASMGGEDAVADRPAVDKSVVEHIVAGHPVVDTPTVESTAVLERPQPQIERPVAVVGREVLDRPAVVQEPRQIQEQHQILEVKTVQETKPIQEPRHVVATTIAKPEVSVDTADDTPDVVNVVVKQELSDTAAPVIEHTVVERPVVERLPVERPPVERAVVEHAVDEHQVVIERPQPQIERSVVAGPEVGDRAVVVHEPRQIQDPRQIQEPKQVQEPTHVVTTTTVKPEVPIDTPDVAKIVVKQEAPVVASVVEHSVAEKTVVAYPVVERSVVERPVAERPVAERPVVEHPVVERAGVEHAVAERPVVSERPQPQIEQPVVAGREVGGRLVVVQEPQQIQQQQQIQQPRRAQEPTHIATTTIAKPEVSADAPARKSPGVLQEASRVVMAQMPFVMQSVTRSDVQPAVSSRTEAIVATVEKMVDAIVTQILVTPSLIKGDGQMLVRLKDDVLDGSTIKLAFSGGALDVVVEPTTHVAERLAVGAAPKLEAALAEHVAAFHHVKIFVKKGRHNEAV